MRLILLLMMFVAVSSCSTYGSSFDCPDSRGASCMAMDKVDKLISSGEIELFTKKSCNCHGEILPRLNRRGKVMIEAIND